MTRRTLSFWVLGLLAVVVGCSKDNEIDASQNTAGGIGTQCSGPDDRACGTNGVCALGYCRFGCLTDGECEQGALCIGDGPPYGCQLPQDIGCSEENPCTMGLVCGLDGLCRMPCNLSTKCPRNEQTCIATTCVSGSEQDADRTWFNCFTPGGPTSVVGCDGLETMFSCNVAGAGAQMRACHCRVVFGSPGLDVGVCVKDPVDPHLSCVACQQEANGCATDFNCLKCAWDGCEGNQLYDALKSCLDNNCSSGGADSGS